MSMTKLPDGNLQVNLDVRGKSGTGPLGQEMRVLERYTHMTVYVPFIDRSATVDNRTILKEVGASFYVNGQTTCQLSEISSFEIPIVEGKTPGFELKRPVLFTNLIE
jgi:hypothetical protein